VAIGNYFSLPAFSAETGGYLYLMGSCKPFFLQQDALRPFIRSPYLLERLIWKKDFPDIQLIRELP